jgi:hypothetical protein
MVSIERLEKTTNEFFNKFCKENTIKPKWSHKWNFKNTLPNNDKKGCYAHLKGDDIVYIGVAISDSNEGSGLGSRISNYWKFVKSENGDRFYEPTVNGIDSIITLPFNTENFYLAAALEIYLIQKLKPSKNRTHSKKN